MNDVPPPIAIPLYAYEWDVVVRALRGMFPESRLATFIETHPRLLERIGE